MLKTKCNWEKWIGDNVYYLIVIWEFNHKVVAVMRISALS